MDVKNILVHDTSGDLSKELFKLQPDLPAVSTWLEVVGENVRIADKPKQVLKLAVNNIRYDSLPGVENITYVTYLAYNGTLGLKDSVFSTVVSSDRGVFNRQDVPILTYDPGNTIEYDSEEGLEDAVLDIKFYNGTVDVITFQEGVLVDGIKKYNAKSIRTYPYRATAMPQVSNSKVFLDGWYSYTHMLYRDISEGDIVIKGTIYAYRGRIFKASAEGSFSVDAITEDLLILIGSQNTAAIQNTEVRYEDVLFGLNEGSSVSGHGNTVFLGSQVLITDELRDAITKETLSMAMCANSAADFADWQKLILKRNAAAIMFENGLFENAQIILESARTECTNNGYRSCN